MRNKCHRTVEHKVSAVLLALVTRNSSSFFEACQLSFCPVNIFAVVHKTKKDLMPVSVTQRYKKSNQPMNLVGCFSFVLSPATDDFQISIFTEKSRDVTGR